MIVVGKGESGEMGGIWWDLVGIWVKWVKMGEMAGNGVEFV